MNYKIINLFGQKFFSGTTKDALLFIETIINKKRTNVIAAINIYLITECHKNKELADFYNGCDLVTVDGRPLVYASHLLSNNPFPELVGGPNLWLKLLVFASENNYSLYFIGSTNKILNKAKNNLRDLIPNLNVIGMHNGYFSFNSSEYKKIVSEIKIKNPGLIYIGMPTPKKEVLAKKLRNELNNGVLVLIGGAFDVFAEEKKIASELISKLCLEWFYRMMLEPNRLFMRYFKSNIKFLLLLLKELLKK